MCTSPPPVSLPDKLRFLSEPATYPERPPTVELRETHLSYVFLTPTEVYKMKKPVANGYVDLQTLAAREANCRAEVQLNRRLAPHVYLGIIPLMQRDDGALALGGAGSVVEWLVQMRRLPAAAMMDDMIRRGMLTPADVATLAQRLADFFAMQGKVDISVAEHTAQLRHEIEVSMQVLLDPRFALPAATLATVQGVLARYLDHGTDLAARVDAGRIIEGHGDLRPEHVCLSVPPVVIDCLEFNRALRRLDPFDEVAFLALECARLGAPWVGPRLRQDIATRLQDDPPLRLSAFYTALRGCIRARLVAAHLLESVPRTPEKWLPLARDYLARAEQACAQLD
jgi:aminoglycoside phosphotransferase family enzyme